MDIGSIVNQGLTGMQRSQAEMLRSAQQIASGGIGSSDASAKADVVEPLLNIKAQSQLFDSSARVVKAASESIGTLLNAKA